MIKLDNKFHLENDANQWILHFQEEGELNPKTGKNTIRTNVWYSGTIKNCLNRYITEAVKPSKDVKELIKNISNLEKIINNIKL